MTKPHSSLRKFRLWFMLVAAAALVTVTGCGSDGGAADRNDRHTATATTPTETAAGSFSLPLSKPATFVAGPAWEFPASISGWKLTTIDQGGVNQLSKIGGSSLFTSFQLTGSSSGSDADNTETFLESFIAKLKSSPDVKDVSAPKLSTTTIKSADGTSIEFVQQDLTYTTANGTTYRSRYVARALSAFVVALQYAGPKNEWTQAQWQTLTQDVRLQGTFHR